ncbi:MAG: S1C family serine protease [Thermoleophilaceae bacterium]
MTPSDLWAGGAAGRPRPKRPRRPGPIRPASAPPGSGEDGGPGDDRSRWQRVRLPLAAATALALVALALGVLLGQVGGGGGGGADPAVIKGAAGAKTNAGKVYAAAGPAVVSVRVTQGGQQDSGTGFLVGRDGTIVTNAHVVGDARRASVRFNDSGPLVRAVVRGTDASSDLAVLKVEPGEVGSRRPLALADSNDVRVGDEVLAIGYPLGLDRTATAGIVSGLERDIQAPNGFQIDKVIQTDAPINPGNSGGPLLDRKGRVVGVNSQIASAGGSGNIGIGFAVPADSVRAVLPRLRAGERIERAFVGLTTQAQPGGGAKVQDTTTGGPAAQAGIKRGLDVIVGVDGRPVGKPEDLSSVVAAHKPGDTIRVTVRRGGDRRTVTVRLTTRPERLPGGP